MELTVISILLLKSVKAHLILAYQAQDNQLTEINDQNQLTSSKQVIAMKLEKSK